MFLCNFHADTPTRLYRSRLPFSHPTLEAGAHAHLPFRDAFEVYAIFSERSESDEVAWNTCFRKLTCFRRAVADSRLPAPRHIFAVEDARILAGDLSRLATLRIAGVRVLVLVWKGESAIGGAHDTSLGLTPFGREAVAECFRLGIVPDLSHASDALAYEVIDMARAAGRPVIASHSNFRAVCPVMRNLPDEICREIAALGGAVGISLYPPHLAEGEAGIDEVIAHIRHGLALAPGALVLGTDFDGIERTPRGLPTTAALPRLAERMLSLGYSDGTVRDLFYRNGVGFLGRCFPELDFSTFI